ncbi:hypothetical protein [Rickettsiella endosymbiont of Xylota segnis]|uniref:hypothetical protein n=1 Tax=Rickettsiella endosymbiont of Xylota segnis TaxID=3066238 RepID=UPI0030CE00D1
MPKKYHQLTENHVVTLVPPIEKVYDQKNFNGNLFDYLNFLYEKDLSEKLNKGLIESQKPKGNCLNKISAFFSLECIKTEKPTQSTFQSYIK